MQLIPDQYLATIFLRKAFRQSRAVFESAPWQVRRNSRVERPATPICHDVDAGLFHGLSRSFVRHRERSEAIQLCRPMRPHGLPRRFAPDYSVIASAAKQSSFVVRCPGMDCRVAALLAMTLER